MAVDGVLSIVFVEDVPVYDFEVPVTFPFDVEIMLLAEEEVEIVEICVDVNEAGPFLDIVSYNVVLDLVLTSVDEKTT